MLFLKSLLNSNKEDMKKCPSQTGKCPEPPPVKTSHVPFPCKQISETELERATPV